jgi:hypothetical protein
MENYYSDTQSATGQYQAATGSYDLRATSRASWLTFRCPGGGTSVVQALLGRNIVTFRLDSVWAYVTLLKTISCELGRASS